MNNEVITFRFTFAAEKEIFGSVVQRIVWKFPELQIQVRFLSGPLIKT